MSNSPILLPHQFQQQSFNRGPGKITPKTELLTKVEAVRKCYQRRVETHEFEIVLGELYVMASEFARQRNGWKNKAIELEKKLKEQEEYIKYLETPDIRKEQE